LAFSQAVVAVRGGADRLSAWIALVLSAMGLTLWLMLATGLVIG
jgi:hypothetical protein